MLNFSENGNSRCTSFRMLLLPVTQILNVQSLYSKGHFQYEDVGVKIFLVDIFQICMKSSLSLALCFCFFFPENYVNYFLHSIAFSSLAEIWGPVLLMHTLNNTQTHVVLDKKKQETSPCFPREQLFEANNVC